MPVALAQTATGSMEITTAWPAGLCLVLLSVCRQIADIRMGTHDDEMVYMHLTLLLWLRLYLKWPESSSYSLSNLTT